MLFRSDSGSGATSFTIADESRYSTLQAVRPLLDERPARPPRGAALRGQQGHEVVARRDHPTREHEAGERPIRLGQGREHGDGSPTLRHLQTFAPLHPAEVLAEVLPQLPDTDSSLLHVAQGST